MYITVCRPLPLVMRLISMSFIANGSRARRFHPLLCLSLQSARYQAKD